MSKKCFIGVDRSTGKDKSMMAIGHRDEDDNIIIDSVEELVTEERECQECGFFRDFGIHTIPICTKLLMGVTRTMHATYSVKRGTCFEEKENGN